jgi:hypothetical protein
LEEEVKNDVNLEMLAQQYLEAKAAEDAAIANRRSIGKMIEDALPGPDEGTARTAMPGITVTVTRKLTRKVDSERLSLLWGELGENVQNAFKWKVDLNTKHYRALQELATAELTEANQFITSSPAASSVEVKLNEEK